MYRSRWALACALVAALVSGRVVAQEAAAPNKESADICDSERAVAQAARRIERILNQSLKTPLSFTQVPLSQVMDQLAEEYDLPIVFDRAALEAAATSPDVEVTVELNNVSLRSAFELMLRQLEDLTFMIDQEVLLITTQDEADQRLEVCVYRVDDLVLREGAGTHFDDFDFDRLIVVITSNVEQDSWKNSGHGEGEIHPYVPGILIISQTHRVHEQVRSLLCEMRQVKGEIESQTTADDTAVEAPVTRGIAIKDESMDDSEASREMVRNAIVQSVEWGSDAAANTGEHFLYVLPQRVIVRHQPHVVRQVERVMADMGTNANRRTSRGGGGGFF